MHAKTAQQVGAVLDFAHQRGVDGRVMPSNIVLAKDGRMLLADFAVTRISGEQLANAPALIDAPEYLAPEQAPGGKGAGPRADLYALAIIYELLVGRVTFKAKGPSRLAVLHMQQNLPPSPPSSVVSGFP